MVATSAACRRRRDGGSGSGSRGPTISVEDIIKNLPSAYQKGKNHYENSMNILAMKRESKYKLLGDKPYDNDFLANLGKVYMEGKKIMCEPFTDNSNIDIVNLLGGYKFHKLRKNYSTQDLLS